VNLSTYPIARTAASSDCSTSVIGIATRVVAPVCVALSKLLLGAVAVALAVAYLALCLSRALEEQATDEAAT
jgi:hypothetical protein